jgi:hypothetical protein
MRLRFAALLLFGVGLLAACGGAEGGGGGGRSGSHPVTLAWAPSRESGVNRTGGGYQIAISGQPALDVPYVSGSSAPTSTTAKLPTGSYTVTVRAYAPLDAQGGSTGTLSAPSQSITVTVP